jgi:hypothetical protein
MAPQYFPFAASQVTMGVQIPVSSAGATSKLTIIELSMEGAVSRFGVNAPSGLLPISPPLQADIIRRLARRKRLKGR